MRIACWLGCLCAGLIAACEQPEETALPPDETLIGLMIDLHEAEATLNRVPAEKQDSMSALLRQRIASSNGITPEEMDTWLDALQKSPEHLLTVYDSVVVRMERLTRK